LGRGPGRPRIPLPPKFVKALLYSLFFGIGLLCGVIVVAFVLLVVALFVFLLPLLICGAGIYVGAGEKEREGVAEAGDEQGV